MIAPLALVVAAHAFAVEPPRSFVRLLDDDGRWFAGRVVALDDTHWTLETREFPLRADSARVERMARGSIVAGVVRRWAIEPVPASYFDALAETPTLVEPLSNGMLELADGQRIPGTYKGDASGAVWNHRWIGAIPIETDRLASIRFIAAAPVVRRSDADTVMLTNGDVLVGFVDALGADLTLDVDAGDAGRLESAESAADPVDREDAARAREQSGVSGSGVGADAKNAASTVDEGRADAPSDGTSGDERGSRRKIGVDRIASIGFAALEQPESPSAKVWTMDGSVVGARGLRFDETQGWSFTLTDPLLSKIRPRSTADNLAADPIGFVLEAGRMTPLAALGTPRLSVPDGASHVGVAHACRIAPMEQVALGLSTIELAGPVRAEFETNGGTGGRGGDGVATFSAWIELAQPTPLDATADVEVSLGPAVRERVRLDPARPGARIVLSISAAQLREIAITVTDAGNGSIGDRIEIERAAIVVSSGLSRGEAVETPNDSSGGG